MRIKSQKIRESAKWQDCNVRLPSVCNFNPETTVLAHVGKDRGRGLKASDIHATYACSNCHDVMDGKVKSDLSKEQVELYAWHGVERTQSQLVEAGLIEVPR